MKPVYLVDLISGKIHKFYEDKTPKKIGRKRNCYIVTPQNDLTISRVHLEVRYVANEIRVKQIGKKSTTFIESNGKRDRLQYNETDSLLFGDVLILGDNGFRMELRQQSQVKGELGLEKKLREEDTIYEGNIEN